MIQSTDGNGLLEGVNIEMEKIDKMFEKMVLPMVEATNELVKINKRMDEIITYVNENGIYTKKQE